MAKRKANQSPPPLLRSVPEQATRLGIGLTLAWRLVREGRIPVVRLGGRTLVADSAIDALVARLQQGGAK